MLDILRRTGRGNVEAARKPALHYHATPIKTLDFGPLFELGVFYLLEDKPDEALDIFSKSMAAQPTFLCTYMVAQLSRERGDEKSRKEAIAAMEEAIEKAQNDQEQDGLRKDIGQDALGHDKKFMKWAWQFWSS